MADRPSPTFTIPYRNFSEYVPVDIARLRPKDSYTQLLSQRTHPIEKLVQQHGRIPEHLLHQRECPTCGSTESRHELSKDHLELVRCVHCDQIASTLRAECEHIAITLRGQCERGVGTL